MRWGEGVEGVEGGEGVEGVEGVEGGGRRVRCCERGSGGRARGGKRRQAAGLTLDISSSSSLHTTDSGTQAAQDRRS